MAEAKAQQTKAQQDKQIDPRGYRIGAGITAVVAIVALVLGGGRAGSITAAILAVMFVPGATIGPQATLQSFLFRTLIRPRIGAPKETESFRPPRFAQLIGLLCAVAAAVFGFAGSAVGFYIFAGFVLAASFLNSVFGFCLGCEIYLLLKRLGSPKTA
jgi:hypothetical protein